jgi:hypothetical protein
MGELIGLLVRGIGKAIDAIDDLSKEKIAKALRDLADDVEADKVIPRATLERANARKARRDSIRDSLPSRDDEG